jgi:peptide/nickel transport system permease protein
MSATTEIRTIRPLRRSRPPVSFVLAAVWVGLLVVLAIAADWLPLTPPDAPVGAPSLPPFSPDAPLLGTDAFGRDVLSRLVFGIRISFSVSIGATAIAAVCGMVLGLVAAYSRGAVERGIAILLDAVLAFPPLLLLMAIAAIARPGVSTLIVALGVLFIPPFARLIRAAALSQLQRDYVKAARALGAGHIRVMVREVLPNSIQPLISYAAVVMALVIVIEGSLSFLGVGVPPPAPSWGSMIAGGKEFLATAPYLVAVPAIMICVTVLALNVIGDRLRTMLHTKEM